MVRVRGNVETARQRGASTLSKRLVDESGHLEVYTTGQSLSSPGSVSAGDLSSDGHFLWHERVSGTARAVRFQLENTLDDRRAGALPRPR